MKVRYILGTGVIALAIGASMYLLSQSQVEYTSIAKAKTTNNKVQIKGQWVDRENSLYDPQSNIFHFILQDEEGNRISVHYYGAKPNHLELAQAVVVRGHINGNYFEASDILTKCPSKYENSAPLTPSSALHQ